MNRKIVMAGKLKPGVFKPGNMQEIINDVNNLPISKKKKYILLLANITLLSKDKKIENLIARLELFKQNGADIPGSSSDKYISNIIKEINKMETEELKKIIEELIIFLKEGINL